MSIQTHRPAAKVLWAGCILSMSLGLTPITFAQDSEPPPPPSAAPSEMPPPPAPAAAAPEGQWVFTSQYGWVFMPYAESYTYLPANGDPLAYVYGPALGWRWLAAPWIFGVGPHPYWGQRGFSRFAWHAHPRFAPRFYAHPAVGAFHARAMHMHGHRR